jgi:hypothetical protein
VNILQSVTDVRGTPCGASACVSVPTISAPILVSDGAHAPYCTNDCQFCHTPRRKLKLNLRMINLRIGQSRKREQFRMTLKSPLVSDGAHAPYCTTDCQFRHDSRRKLKLNLRMIHSAKHACGAIPRV